MMPCPNSPPCRCDWHRAQIAAFLAWQEEIFENGPVVEGDTLGGSWNSLS
jgi:hypothetical protein